MQELTGSPSPVFLDGSPFSLLCSALVRSGICSDSFDALDSGGRIITGAMNRLGRKAWNEASGESLVLQVATI